MTLSVQLTEAGPMASDFPTLLAELQNSYKIIFGQDAYIEADSMDGQLLAVFANEIHNCNNATINAINSFSPSFASGTALSSVVKINGISRQVPTNSTAIVTLFGQVGKSIINGQVQDIYGNYWALPSPLTFPNTGELIVSVTAIEPGAISVQIGDINKIATPTLGWQSVINNIASVPGQPVESDSELRARQTISVALPALTTYQSIQASIANLTGVSHLKIYENDTDITDGIGVPAHSIWAVVRGGDPVEICTAIGKNKSPGTGTYGSVTENVEIGGTTTSIKYGPAIDGEILVDVHIKPNSAYNSLIDDRIKQNIVNYFNSLEIGQTVEYSQVLAAAVGPEYNTITVLLAPSWADPLVWGTSDISLLANDLAICYLSSVSITIVP